MLWIVWIAPPCSDCLKRTFDTMIAAMLMTDRLLDRTSTTSLRGGERGVSTVPQCTFCCSKSQFLQAPFSSWQRNHSLSSSYRQPATSQNSHGRSFSIKSAWHCERYTPAAYLKTRLCLLASNLSHTSGQRPSLSSLFVTLFGRQAMLDFFSRIEPALV